MTHEAVAVLSSNYGDRPHIINEAVNWMCATFQSVITSSVYEMPAINGRDASYLNAVAMFKTELTSDDIVKHFKAFESRMGRTSASKSEGRIPLDLDLVIFDSAVVSAKEFSQSYFTRGFNELLPNAAHNHVEI